MGGQPCKECTTTEVSSEPQDNIKDNCDSQVNGGEQKSTTQTEDDRYSLPDDYNNGADLKFQSAELGDERSTTEKEEFTSHASSKPEVGHYSFKKIIKKCKDNGSWCSSYMNCLRRTHRAADIFPELEEVKKVKLPEETFERIKKTCKTYDLEEKRCEDLEMSVKKGVIFKQLLGRLVEGTEERRGSRVNDNRDNIGYIIGGIIAATLLLIFFLLNQMCYSWKKKKKRTASKKSSIKSGPKSSKYSDRKRNKRISSQKSRRKTKSGIKSSAGKSKFAFGKSLSNSVVKSCRSKPKKGKQK